MPGVRISDTLQSLCPAGVICHGGPIEADHGPLYPAEQDAIADAVPVRQAEFSAGRSYARLAISTLGFAVGPIPVARSRAPIWPEGCIGSIAHTRTQCVAAVARTECVAGIGIDIEIDDPLDDDLISMVQRSDEVALPGHGLHLPKLLFVIKEAVYKAQFPLSGVILEFSDVRVKINPARREFQAVLSTPMLVSAAGHREFSGRFSTWQDHILAVAVPGSWPDG